MGEQMSEIDAEDDVSTVMRFLSVAAIVAGVAALSVYPWAVKNFSGREIGTYRVYDGGRFPVAVAILGESDAPVRVMVDVVAVAPLPEMSAPLMVPVEASTRGRVVFSKALRPREVATSERNLEVPDPLARHIAGLIPKVEPGIYSFAIGSQGISGTGVRSVDIVLRGGVMEISQRVRPLGFFLAAAGLAGIAIALARGHRRTTKAKPPAPRWGRDADKS